MNSTPHQTRRSGRPAFLLLSVLALLALACFPVIAHAEESVGPVYDPEVPKVPGQTKKHKEADPKAENSKEGGAVPVGNGEDGGGSDGPSANNNPSTPNPSTPGGEATGQDGSGNGPPAGKDQGKSQQQELAQGKALGPDTSADDSSSPLVPILIAIAVLAAISIGVVVIRQRRQRQSPGAQVSPKAS